jgi:hypothetical protein
MMPTDTMTLENIYSADLNSSYQAMLANMRSATVGWNF